MTLLRKVINSVLSDRTEQRRANLYRDLIRHEAKIGGQVFGPTPVGVNREFFCLDEHTWVWHEEWKDQTGQLQIKTTRYDVRPDGVLKSQNGHYQKLSIEEAQRLLQAAHIYAERVSRQLYTQPA
jgi:hypothetical protein